MFIESILFKDVNPEQIRYSNFKFRHINKIENKLTQFQIYPEIELARKYTKPLYKTQYSEILVEYEDGGFDMNTGKLIILQMATSQSSIDENSYVPVKFQKNWWKTKTTRHRHFTLTGTITNEQPSFWRNPL